MGIVSSIKDFIGVEHEENDFDYEAYEEQAEYEAEDEQPRRSFGGRFQQRREELSSAYDKVNFEFGFGLSYTTFSVTNQKVSAEKDKITVTATVTNTGKVSGKEVLQVYFSAPQMGQGGAKLSKPAKAQTLGITTKKHCRTF